jgi:hypothetical protein
MLRNKTMMKQEEANLCTPKPQSALEQVYATQLKTTVARKDGKKGSNGAIQQDCDGLYSNNVILSPLESPFWMCLAFLA